MDFHISHVMYMCLGNLLSFDSELNVIDKEILDLLNSSVNDYLQEKINGYLYKTSKEYKSDIAGFGKHLLLNYLTWDEWISSDWLSNYENAFFAVNVETTIQSGQLYNGIK